MTRFHRTLRVSQGITTALLAGLIELSVASPVAAATTTTGGGILAGSVTMGAFPCTNCIGGQFSGTVELALTGVATSTLDGVQVPYAAYWAGQAGNASAVFNFNDPCAADQPADLPPLVGTADGSFTITDGVIAIAGQTYQSATLSGGLNWTRVGVTARVTLFGLSITASDGSIIALNLTNTLEGQGLAAFAWTNGPGTCAVTQTNQTAQIAGIDLQPV